MSKPSKRGRQDGWTKAEDELLLRLKASGVSSADIARQVTALGRLTTANGVDHRAKNLKDSGAVVAKKDTDPYGDNIERLVAFTRKKPKSLEEVCDHLDFSPLRVRCLVDEAHKRGFAISLTDDHVGRAPEEDKSIEAAYEATVSQPGDTHSFAAVGDIHLGSKHHLRGPFEDFCAKAYARGCRQFLHVGDLLDGNYRHSLYEQTHRGFEEQVMLAVEVLPKMPDATWHFIQGNHDETLGEVSGLDVGRAIEERFRSCGRNDLVYHGPRSAYIRLKAKGEKRGLLVELWHPRDRGNAYALSYRLQKKVEGYAPGSKPDLLLAGHWHQSIYLCTRGVHAMSTGCWQGGQSSFGKSLANSPSIGSWIIDWALTPQGTVRTFSPTWIGFFEKEVMRSIELT